MNGLAVARPQLRPVRPGVELEVVRVHDAGGLVPQQHQRPRHGGHVHRLPVAVQDQRRSLEYSWRPWSSSFPSRVSGRSRTGTLWFTASRAETATPQTPYITVSLSTPTRSRTRNTSLEARHDVRFTIGAHYPAHQAEGKGFEPTSPRGRTALAERPGQPYPATFRNSSGPTGN